MRSRLDTLYMAIVGVAAVVDATENYVTNTPVNGMGLLLLGVVAVYFMEYFQERLRARYMEEVKDE